MSLIFSRLVTPLIASAVFMSPMSVLAADRMAGATPVAVTEVVSGLDEPWAIDFLPGGLSEGGVLISEIDGRLLRVQSGEVTVIEGTPEVWESGQGGLLDIMIPRDFAESGEVFLSYSKPIKGGAGTALGVGKLEGDRLVGFRDLFVMAEGSRKGQHFGSRIVESTDGTIFLTVGERGEREAAQDKTRANGSVLRINRNGSIPADNPFADDDALPALWSYGHRNPQGAALDGQGQLWVNEHGPQGGDEINLVAKGANYGWPLTSYGENYGGGRFAPQTLEGTEPPAHQWTPSIAPSGYAIYAGDLFPELKGKHLIGSLKFDYISVMDPADWQEEQWSWPETGRVRDITVAPDGAIWFLSVGKGAAYRIAPRD